MTQPIQLFFATQDGQTGRIADRLAKVWQAQGETFRICNLSKKDVDFPQKAAAIVLLAPIRFGHHLPPIESFIKKHKKRLHEAPLVLISVNVTARKPEKNSPATNPYYKKWVRRHGLRPDLGAVLGGRLEYRLYKTWEKWVIRFIMFLTGGPTNFDAVVDYTPWDKVDLLARDIAALARRKDSV